MEQTLDISQLTLHEKLNLGLKLHKNKITVSTICKRLGISTKTFLKSVKPDFLVYLIFFRYKARAGENEEVSEVDHIGRPNTLSPEAMEILKNEVDEQTKTLTAFTIERFENRINELTKSNKKRKFRHKVCKRTCERIKKQISAFTMKGKRKPRSRVEAFNDIRNPISYCSLLNQVQTSVHRSNFHSLDDVTVLVNPMVEECKIIISNEGKMRLLHQNVSLSTIEAVEKQRTVTYFCAISGDAKLTVT
jgi:hypothetical protein